MSEPISFTVGEGGLGITASSEGYVNGAPGGDTDLGSIASSAGAIGGVYNSSGSDPYEGVGGTTDTCAGSSTVGINVDNGTGGDVAYGGQGSIGDGGDGITNLDGVATGHNGGTGAGGGAGCGRFGHTGSISAKGGDGGDGTIVISWEAT